MLTTENSSPTQRSYTQSSHTQRSYHQNSHTQLDAQHTLHSEDLFKVCSLAQLNDPTGLTSEQLLEQISTFSFEQFFGFTCHLFITTQSSDIREQLAHVLNKFGSVAVLSLIKISHHFPEDTHVHQLALQSLESMALKPLSIGMASVIKEYAETPLMMAAVVPNLIRLIYHHDEAILSSLSQQLSQDLWNNVETQLLQALSNTPASKSNQQEKHRLKIRVKGRNTHLHSQTASSTCSQSLEIAC